MKNNITEVVFILDASGSMHDLTDDTIGGFNSMLAKQREKDAKVYVSTVTFNTVSKVIHDRVDIKEVRDMTKRDYVAGGCTALLDAMGDAIHHISNIHKYSRPEDVPENTLFIITTDGLENSSRKYTSSEVKKMVEAKKEIGWDFIFMGANIDAVETAASYGIDRDMAVDYLSDKAGSAMCFMTMNELIETKAAGRKIDCSWRRNIENDMKKRGQRK